MRILLTLTLCGSLLTLLLLLLKKILGLKFSSTVYYYAWLLVLLRFLLPMPGFLPLTEKTAAMPEPVRTAAYQVPELSYDSSREEFTDRSTGGAVARTVSTAETNDAALQTKTAKPLQINWKSPKLWLTVWAGGALLSLLHRRA